MTDLYQGRDPRDIIVVIDPRIAFGRLVIDGTGIPTHIIDNYLLISSLLLFLSQ